MKHFIYTYTEKARKNDSTLKTVSIWQIVRNQPRHLITRSDTFVSKDQLVLESLKLVKGMPRAWFEVGHHGGFKRHSLWHFKTDGIATFTEI